MRKSAIVLSILAVSSGIAFAADTDPIATRQQLMEANGAAAALSGGMLKGDIPYNATAAKSALETFRGTSAAFGSFFPDDSREGGHTSAAPKIWSDRADFDEAIAKFHSDSEAGVKMAGKEGPADLAAFKKAVGPILGNCKSCHQDYRVRR